MRQESRTFPAPASAAPEKPADVYGRIYLSLLGGGAAALSLGAGGLLWWRHGDAVFSNFALSGLAWCF